MGVACGIKEYSVKGDDVHNVMYSIVYIEYKNTTSKLEMYILCDRIPIYTHVYIYILYLYIYT